MNIKAIYNPRYRALIKVICGARKQQGLTQLEMGRRLRLSRQTVQKIESCEVRLDVVRFVSICRLLGLNAGQLLGRLEEPSDEDDFSLAIRDPCRSGKRSIQHYFTGHLLATFLHEHALFGTFGTF